MGLIFVQKRGVILLKHFSFKKHEKGSAAHTDVNLKEPKGEVRVTGLPPIQKKEPAKQQISDISRVNVKKEDVKILATYNFVSDGIPITINIYKKRGEFVPIYDVSISSISKNTEIILEKIREEMKRQQTSLSLTLYKEALDWEASKY